MAYIQEFDELPWEARQGVATTFRFWPKIDGRNVLASATSGHCYFTVHDPSGTSIQSQTSITPTTVGAVSRLDIAVSAISTLDESYTIRLTWRESGSSTVQFDTMVFDVVLYPFGQPWTSLNDLLDLRSSAADALDRMGQNLEYASGDEAREYAAGLCAYNGRLRLDARIRDEIINARLGASETSAKTSTGTVKGRPHLILDRRRLIRVERLEAAAHLYRSLAPDPEEGEDPMSALYRHFRDEASAAWQMVGPLRYDASEDLVPDSVVEDVGRVIYHRRVQA